MTTDVREVSGARVGSPVRFSMNRTLNAIAVSALLAVSAPTYAQQVTTQDQIIGTWKGVSLKGLTAGVVKYPLGEQPHCYVTVTPSRMWLLFVDSRRAAPASAALTAAEAITAMKTSVAWTGAYTIGGQSPDGLKTTARVDTVSSYESQLSKPRTASVRFRGHPLVAAP
jgi:Lipocalin-like domain